jgi:serine/threonine protein kinase
MAQPARTVADFLAVLAKSGLVDEARLGEMATGWPEPDAELPDALPQAFIDAGLLTHWQVEQLRNGKHRGFMLGKYRLLRLLGAGGMSSVYLAENTTLRQEVAIKVLPVKRVEQTSFLARFEREARTAFRLGHQNLARAFDLDQAGAIHFIVMEYIDGIDLHAKVKQEGPLEIREALELVRQAALGLHYAHEEGLVHRDIKPANLILDRKGTVKVLDLGLALPSDDEREGSLTREHDEKVLGTADYLAPEQASDSHTVDRRSDIYSLGCTLYYLLVGRAPFAKGKLAERIKAHAKKPPPNILETRPDVPPPIADLYFRMLEKHPDARPQTAEEVATTLSAWLSSTAAGPAGSRPGPPRRSPPRGPAGPRSTPPPSPVFRHGPRSGGSSSVTLGPRPSPRPRPPAAGQQAAPAVAQQQPAAAAGGQSTAAGAAQHRSQRRRPAEFAGLPLGFWVAVISCLLAVIVLGAMVFLRYG